MRFLTSLVLFGFLLCAGPSSAQLSSSGAGCSVNCGGGNGIFTVVNIGTNGAASPSIGSVTVPGGATIFVEVTDQGTAVGTLSDGTNTYTLVTSISLNNTGADGTLGIFSSSSVAALSSATLSYTPHGTSANMSAFYVTAPSGAVIVDVAATATNSGNSTTPTVTSGVPTNSGELFLAAVAQTSNSSIAQAPGWTTPFNSVTTENPPLFGGHQTNPGPSATSFTPGGGTSNPWATVVTALESSCPQASTFIARTSGLSATENNAYNALICGMVSDGTFQLLDGLFIFATNTTTTAYLNLISTSYTLATHGSSTFTANCCTQGDGTSGYFDPSWTPSTAGGHFALNSATLGVCDLTSKTTSSTTNFALGSSDNASNVHGLGIDIIDGVNSNLIRYELNNSHLAGLSPGTNSLGSWIESRTGSTVLTFYFNGVSTDTDSTASNGLNTTDVYIGAFRNSSGTAVDFFPDKMGYVLFGGGLTSTQALAVYNRLHTYLTAVGAPSGC